MTFQPTPLPLAEALAHARDLAQAQIEAAGDPPLTLGSAAYLMS